LIYDDAIFTIVINQRWFELNKLANLIREMRKLERCIQRKNQVNAPFADACSHIHDIQKRSKEYYRIMNKI